LAAAEADIDEEKEMAELQADKPTEEEETTENDLEAVANHGKLLWRCLVLMFQYQRQHKH